MIHGNPSSFSRRALLGWGSAFAAAPAWQTASAARTSKAAPVIVGALFPASGPLSLPGDEAFRGVALAAAAHHHAPTPIRDIRLIRASAADAAGAARATHRLIHHDRADIILGTCSSTLSFAASAIAELAGIPYVELDAPADGITARGFKTLIRTGLTTTDLAKAAVKAITAGRVAALRRGHQTLKLALLFDVGATDGAFAAAMIAACKTAGLPILMAGGYSVDTADLDRHVARMKRAGIDIVVHAGNPDGVLLFYEAMANLAWRPRLIIGTGTGYGMASTGFLLGSALNGALVIGSPLYQADGPSAGVAKLYEDHFAAPPRSSASLNTYVGASLVFESLMAGNRLPGSLETQARQPGALANGWGFALNKAGQNTASFAALQQWRDGRLVTIEPPAHHA
jgi:branched-chain amino acid transport system substrate-binding protein